MNIAEGIEGGYRHKTCSRLCGTPGMGNSLVMKVHYTLGSRKC